MIPGLSVVYQIGTHLRKLSIWSPN